MEPSRFLGGLTDQDAAEAEHRNTLVTADDAKTNLGRREEVRAAWLASLTAHAGTTEGVDLATVLASAERIRSDCEKAEQRRKLDKAASPQIERDSEALGRQRKQLENEVAIPRRTPGAGAVSITATCL